jgi:hypothetical protein
LAKSITIDSYLSGLSWDHAATQGIILDNKPEFHNTQNRKELMETKIILVSTVRNKLAKKILKIEES